MSSSTYSTLKVETNAHVATVTLAHPPLNLLDSILVPDIKTFVREIAGDSDIKVVVFKSDDPDFFAARVDGSYMRDSDGFMKLGERDTGFAGVNPMQHLMLSIRSLPQVTIAQLRGRLRGGGNELAAAMDMRFAAAGQTWLSQIETRLGIIPGGGGTQTLPAMVGRARALEAILGGDTVDAETAERWGWVNRALPPEELEGYVAALAGRIASLTNEQIAATKAAVNAATRSSTADLVEDFKAEGQALGLVYPASEEVMDRLDRAVAGGYGTREAEYNVEATLDKFA